MDYNFDTVLDRTGLSTMKWEAEQARKNNPNLLCFGTAEMDFKAAEPIRTEFQNVVSRGHFGYPYKTDAYYDAILGWFQRNCNYTLKKEWIANSVAIYPSFQGLIEGLSDEGDGVIINTPVHFIFSDIVRSLNRTLIENPLKIENGRYVFDFDDLERKITDRTKLFLLCNPHNPVGRAWTPEELKHLTDICVKHGIIITSDEVYFGLIYAGKKYTPITSISHEAAMNSVTCISTSKSFNLTGVKHSLVISENPELLEKYKKELHKNNEFFGESVFGHAAVIAAFGQCDEWLSQLMAYMRGNYELICEYVKKFMPEVKVYEPDATYFAWLDFNCLNMNPQEMTEFFEDEAQTEVSIGASLGTGGEGFIRLNMACPRSVLKEGLERIAKAYKSHM